MGRESDPREVARSDFADFARFVGKVSAAAAEEAWLAMRTPPLETSQPRCEAEPLSLKSQADRAMQEAIAEGRATPRPVATSAGESATRVETPESLAKHEAMGREWARARLARKAERAARADGDGASEDDSDASK
jgi:hypothetical protein